MPAIERVDRLEDLPESPPPADYVIVDVILASTTIVRLLELEVASIAPLGTPEAARKVAADLDDAVLIREQGWYADR
ncbi:MAG: 2-phosphosulfolactate phosphatase [Natrialbaceae archaeon]|nr:2-phosphosulfolactate phosphatase [Natrialbaceae archaeon]